MSGKWRYILYVYVAGAVMIEATLVLNAYQSGGFQRTHSMNDLIEIGLLHLVTVALWPLLIVIFALQYFGVLPGTIDL